MRSYGFTMIELVFIIVILGILASIAVPRFAVTRVDALIAKGRSEVSAIRSGISYVKGINLLKGQGGYPSLLEPNDEYDKLFFFSDNNSSNILEHGIQSREVSGHWSKEDNDTYYYHISTQSVTFQYDNTNGTFDCSGGTYCDELSGR